MPSPHVVITYAHDVAERAIVARALRGAAEVVYLADLAPPDRAGALASATAVLARNTAKELAPGEAAALAGVRLLQFVTAGVDFVPLAHFPRGLPIAVNAGGYAEPMAEHALAMAFAAAKRIVAEHKKLERGIFDQFRANRMLAGKVCGILGFGGIGIATARLMRAVGMQVRAVNRRGAGPEPLDWIGTPDKTDDLLRASDVLVLAVPLTPATNGMLGARELGLMKRDAILINLARGEVVDEAALYAHLQQVPEFTACIDAWWIEPVRHGRFEMSYPFMTLPNVIGSPHNSSSAEGSRRMALERALLNIRRVLAGEPPQHLIGEADRMA